MNILKIGKVNIDRILIIIGIIVTFLSSVYPTKIKNEISQNKIHIMILLQISGIAITLFFSYRFIINYIEEKVNEKFLHYEENTKKINDSIIESLRKDNLERSENYQNQINDLRCFVNSYSRPLLLGNRIFRDIIIPNFLENEQVEMAFLKDLYNNHFKPDDLTEYQISSKLIDKYNVFYISNETGTFYVTLPEEQSLKNNE